MPLQQEHPHACPVVEVNILLQNPMGAAYAIPGSILPLHRLAVRSVQRVTVLDQRHQAAQSAKREQFPLLVQLHVQKA